MRPSSEAAVNHKDPKARRRTERRGAGRVHTTRYPGPAARLQISAAYSPGLGGVTVPRALRSPPIPGQQSAPGQPARGLEYLAVHETRPDALAYAAAGPASYPVTTPELRAVARG
jgi:hypothetical protein